MNKTWAWEVENISRFLSKGHWILPSCDCKVSETMVDKFELVLPHQLTKFTWQVHWNNIWQRTFHLKDPIATVWGLQTVEQNHKQFVHWRCRLFLSVNRPYRTSCHGTAEKQNIKLATRTKTSVEITEQSNTNKRPKDDIFLGHLEAEYQDVNIEKVENGLSKNKLSAFTKTTHQLRRAQGREITWPTQGGYTGARHSKLSLTQTLWPY